MRLLQEPSTDTRICWRYARRKLAPSPIRRVNRTPGQRSAFLGVTILRLERRFRDKFTSEPITKRRPAHCFPTRSGRFRLRKPPFRLWPMTAKVLRARACLLQQFYANYKLASLLIRARPVSDRRFFGQYATLIVLAFWLIGVPTALAQSCLIDSWHYPYNLAADSVTWSMEIVPGRTCFAGVRFGDVVIERVKLVSPPQSGQIALLGPGFSYTAKQDFAGEDSFTLEVTGMINKRRGNSTIHIAVSDHALGAGAPPVENPPAIVPIPQ